MAAGGKVRPQRTPSPHVVVLMSDISRRFSNGWFDQWPRTDSYLASDGRINRMPLRLTSTNLVVFGAASLDEVMKDFAHEQFRPVTVAGKVPVQIWFNNFIDTDCGPFDRINAYVETWCSLPVTPNARPLDLPYDSPFSYNVAHPEALVWVHRVLCGPDAHGNDTGARAAIAGGREVWGFPKHPAVADLSFRYLDGGIVSFTGALLDKPSITARVVLPERVAGSVTIPVDARTAADGCLTPTQNPRVPGFVPKQTRYGQAFCATLHLAPWDPATDTLVTHPDDTFYGALLQSWQIVPVLKMHAPDFKIVAFRPDGWDARHWQEG
jgi:hypothetical protein